MTVDEWYVVFNNVLSPGLVAILGAILVALCIAAGALLRLYSFVLLGIAGIVTAVVYAMFDQSLITGVFQIRVAGRIVVYSLLLSIIALCWELLLPWVRVWILRRRVGKGR